ncbi:MAG: PQQ-binding-like beta-propeller repeat protein [Halobacterium sp.]
MRVESYEVGGEVTALAADADRLYVGTEHSVSAFEYGAADSAWDTAAPAHQVAIGENVVVAAGANEASAFAMDGTEQWRLQAASDNEATGLLVDERTAYVGFQYGLEAVAVASGRRRWSLSTDDNAVPGFDGDRLLVGDDVTAYAPRGALGGVLADAPVREWTCPEVVGPVRPVVTSEYVLAGTSVCHWSGRCGLHAVAGGDHEYHVELGDSAGQVATDGDRAYVVSMQYGESEGGYNLADTTTLHAIDVATGERRWSFQRLGWFTAPVVADGTVYVGDPDTRNGNGNLHALDAASGDLLWEVTDVDGVTELAAVGDSLFVGESDGRVSQFR